MRKKLIKIYLLIVVIVGLLAAGYLVYDYLNDHQFFNKNSENDNVDLEEEYIRQVVGENNEFNLDRIKERFFEEDGKLYINISFRHLGTNEKVFLENGDFDSLEVLSLSYSKDKNNVYFNFGSGFREDGKYAEDIIISEADSETFEVIQEGIAKDKNYLYVYDLRVEDSDGKTFELLNDRFGKDQGQVYYFYNSHRHGVGGEIPNVMVLEDIDLESFEFFSNNFFRDKNKVYYISEIPDFPPEFIEVIGADPETFEILRRIEIKPEYQMNDHGLWQIYARDRRHVFHCQTGKKQYGSTYRCLKVEILDGADVNTFELIPDKKTGEDSYMKYYAKDQNKVFWSGFEIPGADPQNFELLSGGLSKDSDNLYFVLYGDEKGEYPRDLNLLISVVPIEKNCFFQGRLFCFEDENIIANAESFTILRQEDYAKHEGDIYFLGKRYQIVEKGKRIQVSPLENIPGVDSDSFELLDYPYAKDKNNLYYRGQPVDGLDVNNFKIIKKTGYLEDENGIYHNEGGGPLELDENKRIFFYHGSGVKDNQNVYYKGRLVKGADPSSFRNIDGFFSYPWFEDKNNAYYEDQIVPGLNSEQLKGISKGLTFSDDQNVYCISEIDKSFNIINVDIDSFKSHGSSGYYKDDFKVYYFPSCSIVERADPETFGFLIGDGYYKDKYRVYKDGEVVEGADPETFQP